MKRLVTGTCLGFGLLLMSTLAHAEAIIANSDANVGSGTVSGITFCEASTPLPCIGKTFTCPATANINVPGPDTVVRSTCKPPGGFKIAGVTLSVFVNAIGGSGGCTANQNNLNAFVCTQGTGSITVTFAKK